MAAYEVGNVYPAVATFTIGTTPDSPDSVTLRVEAPDGTRSYTPVTTNVAGVFAHDVMLTQAGNWAFTWEGEGAPQAVGSTRIYVAPNAVPPEPDE